MGSLHKYEPSAKGPATQAPLLRDEILSLGVSKYDTRYFTDCQKQKPFIHMESED